MGAIVPAVLPKTREELETTLDRFALIDGVDSVQIDVIDGKFASPANWPYASGTKEFAELVNSGTLLPHAGKLRFEVDLMVRDPEQVTGAWIAVGASRITVHAESTTYLPRVVTDLRVKYGHDKDFAPGLLSFGLAIGLESDLALIEPFISCIDYVQFMGIAKIGRQSQPFERRVLARIEAFRRRHPEMPIQIDGGVTEETAPLLLRAGADRLVVGHDLLQAKDMSAKFKTLSSLAEQYGTYE
ncbi:MAG TPA: hypothetical protein VM103_02115 [Candidatus Paceibacterota bacterium]|nr:hypothetical protein [Candidatus Paceibacterota bacterium]